jgi:ribonucleoside-diphosphate reductase alpha chain
MQGLGGDLYRELIHKTRYARFLERERRRETWGETVERTIAALFAGTAGAIPEQAREEAYMCVHECEVMPSMRVMMTAGPALAAENMCAYNCSYLPIDSVGAFAEVLYLLMCGVGVGFSCERRYVERLPVVPAVIRSVSWTLQVQDSREGWAAALRVFLGALYAGERPTVDYSRVRSAGARLRTMGGRASGPGPLRTLLDEHVVALFVGAGGRRLSPREVHDLVCRIATAAVAGGIRRSALISLSDLDDEEMRRAKAGDWWHTAPFRSTANNSAVFEGRPPLDAFWREWEALRASHSGERGIFNRDAARRQAARSGRRRADGEPFGTNPCCEIILRPRQTCNLSEVVVRPWDSPEALHRKVRVAALLGTLQARLTAFNAQVLPDVWRRNCEEERLLGVSLTGIMDHPLLARPSAELRVLLQSLRHTAVETNRAVAAALGIPSAAAVTCVKPSGTVSQLCDSASGLHPRWSPYYIRRVRFDENDAVIRFLRDQAPALAFERDVYNPQTQVVLAYPIRSPLAVTTFVAAPAPAPAPTPAPSPAPAPACIGPAIAAPPPVASRLTATACCDYGHHSHSSIPRHDDCGAPVQSAPRCITAIEQLELWKFYNDYWCEHKPSISVYVNDTDNDWREVGEWVWNNFDDISGLSFFPRSLGSYVQAPYEAISEEQYHRMVTALPPSGIDWSRLSEYEREDERPAGRFDQFACISADGCEL